MQSSRREENTEATGSDHRSYRGRGLYCPVWQWDTGTTHDRTVSKLKFVIIAVFTLFYLLKTQYVADIILYYMLHVSHYI